MTWSLCWRSHFIRTCAVVLLIAPVVSTLSWSERASADTPSPATDTQDTKGWFGPTSPLGFDNEPHIGPDVGALKYEYAGRWIGAAGGDLIVFGHESEHGQIGLSAGGLLELSNESEELPVPFQLLRARLRAGLMATSRWFKFSESQRGRLLLSVDYTHESDHTSGSSNVQLILDALNIDTDNASSYEYVRVSAGYGHAFGDLLVVQATAGMRFYPDPINAAARRRQRFGYELELSARVPLSEGISIYGAFFTEGVTNELDGFLGIPRVSMTFRGELGVLFGPADRSRIGVYAGLLDMHGKGLDLFVHYPVAGGIGVRANL